MAGGSWWRYSVGKAWSEALLPGVQVGVGGVGAGDPRAWSWGVPTVTS